MADTTGTLFTQKVVFNGNNVGAADSSFLQTTGVPINTTIQPTI